MHWLCPAALQCCKALRAHANTPLLLQLLLLLLLLLPGARRGTHTIQQQQGTHHVQQPWASCARPASLVDVQ
jgi:hypothetical protein